MIYAIGTTDYVIRDCVWDFGPHDETYIFSIPADQVIFTNCRWERFPSLDERFADFKVRLEIALKKHGMPVNPPPD